MSRKHAEDFQAFEEDDGSWVPAGPGSKQDVIQPKMYGGLIPQFEDNYEALDIHKTQIELQDKADKLVEDIIKVYYKMDGDESDSVIAYLNQYKRIESMNLRNLLLQVKASEHVLWSLLNRLNATGSVDNGLYKLITETQEKSIALTMQVSNYCRSLPQFFKQLRFELETNIEMIHVEQTPEMMDQQRQQQQEDSDNFIQRPQKGMRNFLRMVDEMEEAMKKEGEAVEDNVGLPDKDSYNPTSDVEDVSSEDISAEDLTNELLSENE